MVWSWSVRGGGGGGGRGGRRRGGGCGGARGGGVLGDTKRRGRDIISFSFAYLSQAFTIKPLSTRHAGHAGGFVVPDIGV